MSKFKEYLTENTNEAKDFNESLGSEHQKIFGEVVAAIVEYEKFITKNVKSSEKKIKKITSDLYFASSKINDELKGK